MGRGEDLPVSCSVREACRAASNSGMRFTLDRCRFCESQRFSTSGRGHFGLGPRGPRYVRRKREAWSIAWRGDGNQSRATHPPFPLALGRGRLYIFFSNPGDESGLCPFSVRYVRLVCTTDRYRASLVSLAPPELVSKAVCMAFPIPTAGAFRQRAEGHGMLRSGMSPSLGAAGRAAKCSSRD